MNIITAIILGIIEGITEFLPISSTGHLIIAQKLFGIQNVDEFFTVVIQLGAILASVYFFRERIYKIFRGLKSLKDKNFKLKHATINEVLGIWILAATIPALIVGFLLRKQIDEWQNSTVLVAFTTLFFGIVFYIIERISNSFSKNKLDVNQVTLPNVLIMGFFQAVSVIPGVSRSGSTISGGISQNIKMKDSIEISFLMGIPVILAATFYKILSTLSSLSATTIVYTLVGFVVSFIVGLYSIKLTLDILGKKGFFPFMVYRVILGVLILFLLFIQVIK